MRILIAGGAGFIGSNFIYYMNDNYPEYKLFCLDALTYAGNLNNLKHIIGKKNFSFYKGNICDRNFVYRFFREMEFELVINFAAESHVDKSITEPVIFLESNVKGTQVLLDACKKFGVKKFHQISTDEVYGSLPLEKKELKFTEQSVLNPSSPYSASKAAADLLVKSYYKTYNLAITISRCSNNYGPYQLSEKLIPLMIIKALKNEKLPIYGDGKNIRDWIHVKDHCQAIDLIVHKSKPGEVYNIGGGYEKNNLQVVKTILKELKKPLSLISFVKDRKGHDLRYAVDIRKMNYEFDWQPQIDFKNGLKQTIKWYLENQNWWE
ncbi:dTDP-glucose 4,6-dehydratase [Halanaerobium hydrogeniformans]|uniref:dTDP-glucose 4,6-dehydratase n=1 Tax=Halanaerobium hydrogeniformans TaxID=656519 RepID=E4RM11_HALHG|nr:dTDP-glucose 4,6-dehydratase [Halanaerobium hydrogeniformans]ADQ14094.1 dTDP-glucose 4,6-dehydratase [Halanaerobium hydrogeniformans]